MDKIDEGLIASTFQKVKDVDIFALKAYMERTEAIETGLQVTLTDIFVNFPFFLLNLLVGFFSIILRFFEHFSLYDDYKETIYKSSQILWRNLSGSSSYTNSLLYVLVALSILFIFLAFIFSKGDFSRRLLHLFAVMLLGFGYFGTVQSTAGGIYVLDTVHSIANSFSDAVTNLSMTDPADSKKVISQQASIADHYIMQTSYAAYLFVNTGQLNGKFYNNKSGKEEELDNTKILGKYDETGHFIVPKSQKILDYTDHLGNHALEGEEQNRWLSAVNDYIWIKSIYVILKIFEAVIIAIPLLLIQLIAFLADIVVILLMFLFPLALLVSFLPKMQHIVFNVLKLMLGAVSFPALTGFLTLIVFYMQSLIATFIKSRFTAGDLLSSSNLKGQSILFMLFITIIVQGIVFWQIWKHKAKVLSLIVGASAAQAVTQAGDMVAQKANSLGVTPRNIYDKAHDVSNLAMMGAGYGVGSLVHAKDNLNVIRNRFKGDDVSGYNDLSNETDFDHQFSASKDFASYQKQSVDVSQTAEKVVDEEVQAETAAKVVVDHQRDQSFDANYDSYEMSQSKDFVGDHIADQSFDNSLDDTDNSDYQFAVNRFNTVQEAAFYDHGLNQEMESPFISENEYQSRGFSTAFESPVMEDTTSYINKEETSYPKIDDRPYHRPLEDPVEAESPIIIEKPKSVVDTKEPFNPQAEYQRLKAKRQKPLGNRKKAKLERKATILAELDRLRGQA